MATRNKRFVCMDCQIDTGKIGEHYMLVDSVWLSIHNNNLGMLCVGCIEKRLKRELNPADFNDSYLNNRKFGFRSQRLSQRMGFV